MIDSPGHPEDDAPAPRRLSLDYLTVEGATPVEQIEVAAAAGFASQKPAPFARIPVIGRVDVDALRHDSAGQSERFRFCCG